jgi:hypothetical protein
MVVVEGVIMVPCLVYGAHEHRENFCWRWNIAARKTQRTGLLLYGTVTAYPSGRQVEHAVGLRR